MCVEYKGLSAGGGLLTPSAIGLTHQNVASGWMCVFLMAIDEPWQRNTNAG